MIGGIFRRPLTIVVVLAVCASAGCTSTRASSSVSSTTQPTTSTTAAPVTTTPASTTHLTQDGDVLFDQSSLHTFALEVDPEKLAVLDSDPTAEEYVEGRLAFNGQKVGPVGVRYKGSIGAFIGCTDGPNPMAPSGAKKCRKLSMKLKINWEDPEATFYEQRRIQLHAQGLDRSKMHERLGYWLFREMGVPAPRSTHARLEINGEYVGLFALTEQIDGRFTRANFDDGKGNLYKEVWPFDGLGQPQAAEKLVEGLETNNDVPDVTMMTAFVGELAAARVDQRAEVLDRWVDTDQLLRTLVVDRAIANDDGALHFYCFDDAQSCEPHNFFWYEEPTSRKVHLIPWDLDNAFDALDPNSFVGRFVQIADPFGAVTADCAPFGAGPLGMRQRSAACDPILGTAARLTDEFAAIRAELLAGPMAADRINAQLDMWAEQIEPAVAEEAAAHLDAASVASWRQAVDGLRSLALAQREANGR